MSLPNRLSNAITSNSRIVIVVLLLTTALAGAGMPMVDDDSSLDQFESESPEAEALEEMDDQFAAEGDENTTSVQLINRDDEPLSQESLIASLEFQQEIHDNESLNATLAEDDPITGVENILAITAITNEQVDELEEQESALENRTETLEDGVDEALELQREYEELNESGDEQAAAEVEDEIDATVAEAANEAELDADQTDEYEEMVDQARELETNRWMLERQAELPAEEVPEYQELTDALDEVYMGATMGVLEEEYESLEESANELEEEGAELEQRGEELAEREAALDEREEELDQREEELEERHAILEEGAEEVLELHFQSEAAAAVGAEGATAETEDEIDATVAEAADEADLADDQPTAYEEAIEELRAVAEPEDLVTEEPSEEFEQAYAAATFGVLEDEYDQLEEEGEQLAEDGAQLQEDAAEFEEDQQSLEQSGENLGDRESALSDRSDSLEDGLDEVLDLQREYEELEDEGDEAGAAEVEDEIDATVQEAADEAELDADQTDEYEEMVDNAREIESNRWAIEQMPDDLEESEDYQELNDALDDVYAGATFGVLDEEYDQLEEDADELEELGEEQPSLDEQIEALEDLDDEEFEELVEDTLSEDDGEESAALGFMPSDYEPGSTDADARMTLVSQETAGGDDMEMGGEMDGTLESQLDLRELATQSDQEYVVFGAGIITDEIENSMGDSLAIVGPLALLFVVVALAVAYRDPLDIALGVVGIGGVLIWTFGFMGWTGIAFNQMMIAVPVLLIGLSIDYAIHVFMRHREQREADGKTSTVRGSMAIALAGVGVALVWVTATTAIGFLANLVSPIGPIQEFGIVSAFGIVAALIIFGGLIPALKIEIDSLLESRGWDRRKRAFGTGEGRFTSALTLGSDAARKIPMIVLIAALLLTAGGVYGATQVDTSFEEEDFLAESPPAWTEHLPGGMAPGEYQAADDLEYINDNFQREDTQAQILVEGDVTDDTALQQLNETQNEAAENDVVYTLPNGEADVQGPLSVMEDTAADNESFNESFQAADTSGDGVPDQDVEALYDELFEVNEDEASTVIHRTEDGEYESVRLIVATDGGAGFDEVTTELRGIAGDLDAAGTGDERNLDAGDGELNALATGDPIVSHIVEQDLLETVLQSLMITLVAVFAFLTVAYWLTGNSATLGTVTLLPVAFAVSWILGTMHLFGMPFNVLTGMITSLTIGLGVAYSIHVSARYTLELERQGNVWSAMHTTVTGTGGALLGSAATTVGGFGTLAFAILPALRQFGIITGMTIIYSFLASVIVLPTLLVLWTRYFGPDVSFDASRTRSPTTAASDGGTEMETDTAPEDRVEDEP
jgi:predicted RND superfamily exporter protein